MKEAVHALSDVSGEGSGYAATTGVGEKGEDREASGGCEDSVVKLNGARVLEHVAPPKIRAIRLARVVLVPELGGGGR